MPTIQLSETDTVARIAFKSDNWDILNIYGTYENVWGVICDLEGKPDGRNFPLENGENAVIKLGYDYCDFRVEKRNGRELCIFSGDNRNGKAFDVEIVVGNEYEIKSIPVSLAPTSKYEVDSIVYDWESLSYSDNMLEPDYWVMIDNTQSTQPTSWNFDPMESSFPRKISFRDKSGWNEEKTVQMFFRNSHAVGSHSRFYRRETSIGRYESGVWKRFPANRQCHQFQLGREEIYNSSW